MLVLYFPRVAGVKEYGLVELFFEAGISRVSWGLKTLWHPSTFLAIAFSTTRGLKDETRKRIMELYVFPATCGVID
jgi:hypothetical protein